MCQTSQAVRRRAESGISVRLICQKAQIVGFTVLRLTADDRGARPAKTADEDAQSEQHDPCAGNSNGGRGASGFCHRNQERQTVGEKIGVIHWAVDPWVGALVQSLATSIGLSP